MLSRENGCCKRIERKNREKRKKWKKKKHTHWLCREWCWRDEREHAFQYPPLFFFLPFCTSHWWWCGDVLFFLLLSGAFLSLSFLLLLRWYCRYSLPLSWCVLGGAFPSPPFSFFFIQLLARLPSADRSRPVSDRIFPFRDRSIDFRNHCVRRYENPRLDAVYVCRRRLSLKVFMKMSVSSEGGDSACSHPLFSEGEAVRGGWALAYSAFTIQYLILRFFSFFFHITPPCYLILSLKLRDGRMHPACRRRWRDGNFILCLFDCNLALPARISFFLPFYSILPFSKIHPANAVC